MSIIIYNLFILYFFTFLFINKIVIARQSLFAIFFSYLFIVVFISFRFDVGADYYNYSLLFKEYAFADVFSVRPDRLIFFYLSKLFNFWDQGYVAVLAVYTLLTYALLFDLLKKKNILILGFLVFFSFGFFVDTLDRVRQITAAVIVLYAYSKLEFLKYRIFFIIIIAATFVHLTAVLVILAYPLFKINFNNKLILTIVTLLLIFILSDLRDNLIIYFYSMVPYYSIIYTDASLFQSQFNTGLGFLSKISVALLLILFYRVNDIYRNSAFIGLCLYILSFGNLNIERMSMYFLISLVVVVKGMFENVRANDPIRLFGIMLVSLYMIVFIQKSFVDRSNLEYQSVFSDNFKYEVFRRP